MDQISKKTVGASRALVVPSSVNLGAQPSSKVPVVRPLMGPVAWCISLVGITTTSFFLAALSSLNAQGGNAAELEKLRYDEIDPASQTLTPEAEPKLVSDAKSCKEPMTSVTLVGAPGNTGIVRIRSGTYVTPDIRLSSLPTRIALPYPAAYATGHGVLLFETSVFEDYYASLNPTQRLLTNDEAGTMMNVWWAVRPACGTS